MNLKKIKERKLKMKKFSVELVVSKKKLRIEEIYASNKEDAERIAKEKYKLPIWAIRG